MFKLGMLLVAVTATALPIDKLSLPERLVNAPPATVVQLGERTATLAQLRVEHRAHVAAFVRAAGLGRAVASKLSGSFPVVALSVVEPPSQYASAPGDMRAFCQAAHASACLYLPPDQQVTAEQAGVSDWDALVTQAQCAQGGGTWSGMWNSYFCAFNYPSSVIVHFTPAANYKLSKSAACDRTFTYTVDDHGAIEITLAVTLPVIMTTDDNPTCVVTVSPGA
jgi:hypothetical protein